MTATSRLTLAGVMHGHARSRPDRIAFADGAVRLTWPELAARVARLAGALAADGVGSGERVLWLGQNSFRLQELLLACSVLGAGFCPANWRQTPAELAFVIDDLTPRVVFAQREEIGETIAAGRAASQRGADPRWIVHDDADDPYEAYLAGGAPVDADTADVDGDTAVLFVYTAAFGGRPNAAMLSNRALIAQSLLMAPWSGIDGDYVFLNSGPLFHIGTFMPNLSTFVAGGTNVFIRRSDGDVVCEAIAREHCTGGFVVGPMVDAIVEANADGRYDLSSFRGLRGRPEFDAMVQPDRSVWGRNAGGYGQSEVMGMATFNLLAPDAIGTHGRPSPLVELRVVGPGDEELPAGEVGEIALRGLTVMNGYWNRPELNAERSRRGWHHTNDLGRYEPDGSFSFIGPKTRMLKSAAENIYPAEVEGALRTHPAVADAAIIGVPDERWVQSVTAIVVLRDGERASADELIEHCRTRIASYKKPRAVEFVDALPRAGFAVDYDALDAHFGGGGYPGGTTRSA
ncbi:MAG TPA: AMP-binding protein [Acidimicrobiia bacterium]|nr:AMP-binding protein [Acidimicrobiia bacterium]